MEFDKPFKLDKNNIWYIDSRDISTTPFTFDEFRGSYVKKREFLHIEGIDNYIIKNLNMRKRFFSEIRTLHSLEKYTKVQEELPDIGFPVGYYKDNNKMSGIVIPYYEESLSLQKVGYLHKFSELKNYYYHDENEIRNLIKLFLDILDIINNMYEKDIVYSDIHSGNFLLYKNQVKIIDFELGYVHFTTKKQKYLKEMCRNYIFLVQAILRNYEFNGISINIEDDFIETRDNIMKLEKTLRR